MIESAQNTKKIAVLGAGGFVGSRLIQIASETTEFKTVPVLRSFRGLARLGVALPESLVIDTTKLDALTKAFSGAATVVNLTMGDPLRTLEDTKVIYAACVKAGVQQLIHLSSAVVFGRVTDPSIDDDSPPETDSWMLYARGKAAAEVWLKKQIPLGQLKIVTLRPSIIWGPSSVWAEMVGDQLIHGTAVLSNRGMGIANLIYVDNLARIILGVAAKPGGPSGFYNVGDHEEVTWGRYYQELASRLGYPPQSVRLWEDSRFRIRPKFAVEWALERAVIFEFAMKAWKKLGSTAKAAVKARMKGVPSPPGLLPKNTPPILTRGVWVLHNTVRRLPTAKLQRDYGPIELVPFPQALEATAAWLDFAGFRSPAAQSELAEIC